jgi:hypothetical protein
MVKVMLEQVVTEAYMRLLIASLYGIFFICMVWEVSVGQSSFE